MASSTVLGWVLNGPITLGDSSFTSVCFETHSMRCNIENIGQEVENLESARNKFWIVENIETKNHCVIHYLLKDIIIIVLLLLYIIVLLK